MDCKEFSNLLDAYLDGALSPAESESLRAHAAACGDCASLLALRQECRALERDADMPEEFAAAWRQRIREEEAMERKQERKRARWPAYAAAAAALVFILGGTALTRDRLPSAVRAVPTESSAARAESSAVFGKMAASGAASNVSYEDYDIVEEAEEEAAYYDAAVPMAAEAPMPMEASGEASREAADAGSARAEKIIRTASFTIRTAAYDSDLMQLQGLTEGVEGRVEYLNTSGDQESGQNRYAYLTLRIPTARLDDFLAQAKQIGSVTDLTEERQDVSDTYYDIQSRLALQKEKLARLQSLMQSAESVSDLVEIESAVTDAQYWIDRYTSQLKSYDGRVDYSTVYASLREVKVTEMEDVGLLQRIGEGLRGSLRGGVDFLKDALVFLAAALPWLAVIGILTALIWWAVRKRKKA